MIVDNDDGSSTVFRGGKTIVRPAPDGLKQITQELLDELVTVLPFVEDAEDNPVYKRGAVKRRVQALRTLITKAENVLAGRV